MQRSTSTWVLIVVAALFAAGWFAREELGVELSLESLEGVRVWVDGLGWIGIAVFLGMVTFRTFLFLPSAVVLTLGGLAFGSATGTLLGAAGILVSALIQFSLTRVFGRDWFRGEMRQQVEAVTVQLERAGPWLVAVGTAHPFGPLTAFHCGAGLTTMSMLAFLGIVAVSAAVRAGIFSVFGALILKLTTLQTILVAIAICAVAAAPLLHPRIRERILGPLDPTRPYPFGGGGV